MHGSICETWRWICDDCSAISWYFTGPIITLNGQITAIDYMDLLGNQLHPVVQMLFLSNDPVFQDDTLPINTARSVQSWFEEHEDAIQHLKPAQSSDLNIIEPFSFRE